MEFLFTFRFSLFTFLLGRPEIENPKVLLKLGSAGDSQPIQLLYLELHDSPLEFKGELQYLDENCHIRGKKMTILV